MKLRNLIVPVLSLAMLALTGCGKSSSDNPAPTLAPSSVISGLASKGPLKNATVKVFAIKNGVVEEDVPLGTGTTDANGNFTIDVGSFQGAVEVEVTQGSFTDEATGAQVTLKTELRAMVSNVATGTKTVAVTPLTQLASKKAEVAGLTPAAIDDSNSKMSATFGVDDIISTLPIASGTDKQKKHAAACGTISQLVNDRRHSGESTDDALARVMGEMETEVSHNGGLSDDTVNGIKTAETEVESHGGQASTVAPTSGKIVVGTSGASAIGSLDLTVNLPAGVTVDADAATGEAAAGTVTISGVAANGAGQVAAKVASGKVALGMTNTTGFGAGECVTLHFKVVAGGTFPANASAFTMTVTGATATDGKTPINGVTAAPSTLTADL